MWETQPRGWSAIENEARMYVVDEVLRAVDVLGSFNSLGSWLDSNEVSVVAGQAKYVLTVTIT